MFNSSKVSDILNYYVNQVKQTEQEPIKKQISSIFPQTTQERADAFHSRGQQNTTQVPAQQTFESPEVTSLIGQNIGNIFSQGFNNIIKGQAFTQGLSENVGESLGGAAVGYTSNLIGKGINQLGGNSMLSRGIGQGIATGLGTIGGQAITNILNGKNAFQGLKDSFGAIKTLKETRNALKAGKDINATVESLSAMEKASRMAKFNLAGMAGSVIGSGLSAAFGPSGEYNGKYGSITQGMDTAYDLAQTAVGFVPGIGTGISGMMALNKGLSNIFGSTDGMTKTDAILGSAFMPAPVKWLNMAGAKTTDAFHNQSWQNTEKADSFMGNAFGNLGDKFNQAREESGKTYGTFSRGAYNEAQKNMQFANNAWNQILAMADQNQLQNIRSQYMSSINNQRYAQMIQGGWNPIARGKQGMKIFNNATNHNMGMRLLSAAALIDNKQMILCSVVD